MTHVSEGELSMNRKTCGARGENIAIFSALLVSANELGEEAPRYGKQADLDAKSWWDASCWERLCWPDRAHLHASKASTSETRRPWSGGKSVSKGPSPRRQGEGETGSTRSCTTCRCPKGSSRRAASVKETVWSLEHVATKTVDTSVNVKTPATHTVLANSWTLHDAPVSSIGPWLRWHPDAWCTCCRLSQRQRWKVW